MIDRHGAPSAEALLPIADLEPDMPNPSTTMAPPVDPAIITAYHAHVYYDRDTTRERANLLRERVAAQFPAATLGRWHDALVGPHPQSMYQIAFPRELLASFLPWLMLNRDGLTILLHAETGDDYVDHTDHAVWLGAMLPLRLEVFRRA
jgi:DOPA 4,5-dioxygenase